MYSSTKYTGLYGHDIIIHIIPIHPLVPHHINTWYQCSRHRYRHPDSSVGGTVRYAPISVHIRPEVTQQRWGGRTEERKKEKKRGKGEGEAEGASRGYQGHWRPIALAKGPEEGLHPPPN